MVVILSGVHEIAQAIIDSVKALPSGVDIDGFEVDVTKLVQEFSAAVEPSPE